MRLLDRKNFAILIFAFCAFIALLIATRLAFYLEAETSNETNCGLSAHQLRPSCWPQSEWEVLRENLSCAQGEGKK